MQQAGVDGKAAAEGTDGMTTSGSGGISRRGVLLGAGAGAAGVALAPLLAACTGGSSGSSSSSSKSMTVGSNYSDAVPKKAFAALVSGFEKKNSGKTVKVNTVSHNDFQNNINNYLQGSPDDVFTWFAGFRMRFYAKKNLVAPMDDVWDKVGSNFSAAFSKACTGDDGKKYLVPLYNYPWAFFYRKSVWQAKGYQAPKTSDELVALVKQMKKDGLAPIGFADKDQWPACGTFDYLNMRINGYDFHISLMAHEKSWASPEVAKVFDAWKELLPYHDVSGALGRTWQDSAQLLKGKKNGMYLLGSFLAQQFTGADLADLDFFAFPEYSSQYGQDAVEAPIDGLMLSTKGAKNGLTKTFLEYSGTPEAENLYLATDPSDVGAAKGVSTSKYNAIQKKSAELIGGAKQISQFLDRDSLPAFASNVMEPALQDFIRTGKFNGTQVESQAKSVYASNS
jgi:multiple sugar transport system substrate-binding protein